MPKQVKRAPDRAEDEGSAAKRAPDRAEDEGSAEPVVRVRRHRADERAKEEREQRNKTLDEAALIAATTTRKQREERRLAAAEEAARKAYETAQADAAAVAEKRAKMLAEKSSQAKEKQREAQDAPINTKNKDALPQSFESPRTKDRQMPSISWQSPIKKAEASIKVTRRPCSGIERRPPKNMQ